MLVVLGIIVVITSVALLGQSSFNRSLILTDTAYTVALSVREAQSLGLSSRKVTVGGLPIQNAGYGAYFITGNTYVQFADTNPVEPGSTLSGKCAGHSVTNASDPEARPGDCVYTAGLDTIMKTYRFDRGFNVSKFCGKTTSSGKLCSDSGTPLTALNIVFLRPNTESQIIGIQGGLPVELTTAEVFISSADAAATRVVCVSKVGQVAVATSTCP